MVAMGQAVLAMPPARPAITVVAAPLLAASAMARTARQEGFDEIADWFETLAKAEKSHAGRFQKALDTLG